MAIFANSVDPDETAFSSGSTLLAILLLILTETPICNIRCVQKVRHGRVHFGNKAERVKSDLRPGLDCGSPWRAAYIGVSLITD